MLDALWLLSRTLVPSWFGCTVKCTEEHTLVSINQDLQLRHAFPVLVGVWAAVLSASNMPWHKLLCSILHPLPALCCVQVKSAEKAAVNIQKRLTPHALPIRQYLVSCTALQTAGLACSRPCSLHKPGVHQGSKLGLGRSLQQACSSKETEAAAAASPKPS